MPTLSHERSISSTTAALLSEDEKESQQLDNVVQFLSARNAKQCDWESELYKLHFFPQSPKAFDAWSGVGVSVYRQIQQAFLFESITQEGDKIKAYPPLCAMKERKLSDSEIQQSMEYIELCANFNILAASFSIIDASFSTSFGDIQDLPGYQFFDKPTAMLPYLLIENKREQPITPVNTITGFARSNLIFIAASLLHQRLKLRHLGKLQTRLPSNELVVHCITMCGPEAHYLKVGLRAPAEYTSISDRNFVRYDAALMETFKLRYCLERNRFRDLLNHIHSWALDTHHPAQKEELSKAHSALPQLSKDKMSALSRIEMTRNERAIFVCKNIIKEGEQTACDIEMSMVEDTKDMLEEDE